MNVAWCLAVLFFQATTALSTFPLTIAFRNPLTTTEIADVRLGLCEATTRLAGFNTSETSCKFSYLSGTVYNFTVSGPDGLNGLNVTQLVADTPLAIILRQANDGTPIRESDYNVLPPPVPEIDVPGQFWEAQKAVLVICALVVAGCLVLCLLCGLLDRARGDIKTDMQMVKQESSDLELQQLRHGNRKSGSSSSGATLVLGNVATSSRSQRPPTESTTSSPRGSFEEVRPPTREAAVQPRNNSFPSLNTRDSDDGNDGRHPSFTPMVSLPEERSTREKNKPRAAKDRKGYSTQVPETDSDEEPPPPPPESPPVSPPVATTTITSSVASSTSSPSLASRTRPFTVTVVPPSPHEHKSFSPRSTSPQPEYKFDPPMSPAPSPSVFRPTPSAPPSTLSSSSAPPSSRSSAPSSTFPPTFTSSTAPPPLNTSSSFRRPVSPVRKTLTTEPPQTTQAPTHTRAPSRGPPEPSEIPSRAPSPEPGTHQNAYSTRPGRPRTLSRYSVEGSKAPVHPPAFSQGTAELKFAPPPRPRKQFTTDDEDRLADGEVPSLSGSSAKFHSNYKGNPLWDSYTASSDTRNR